MHGGNLHLFREDMVFTDHACHRWTTSPRDGYKSFSDYFRQFYGTTGAYKCLANGRIWPATASTVRLSDVFAVLKSKDEAIYQANKWRWEGKDFKFLSGEPTAPNRVAFNSFRRSGNSFLRRFIEQVSGVVTGLPWVSTPEPFSK